MESHKKVLGIIFIASAAFQVVVLSLLSVFLSTIFSYAISQANPEDTRILEIVLEFMRYLPFIVIIFFSLPTLIAGIGLVKKQKWALILALIIGCLKLFSFPIGTAIGVYAIWVYSEDNRLSKVSPNP
jgi:hypothetical protein